jgi:hypothetical protein
MLCDPCYEVEALITQLGGRRRQSSSISSDSRVLFLIDALAAGAHIEVPVAAIQSTRNSRRAEQYGRHQERSEDELLLPRRGAARAHRDGIPFAGRAPYPADPDLVALRVGLIAAQEGWCGEYSRATLTGVQRIAYALARA